MNKLFTKIAALALGAAMVVGVGVSVGSKSKASQVVAVEEPDETVTFESPDFTATSEYQGTITDGPTGKQWKFYYGTPSTSSVIADSQSAALRLYTSNNYGYLQTEYQSENVTKVSFKIKAAQSNSARIRVNVQYSSDKNTWNFLKMTSGSGQDYSAQLPSTSASTVTLYMPTAVSGDNNVYLKWSIDSTSTKPNKKNSQLTIDDITIYRDIKSSDTLESINIASTSGSSTVLSAATVKTDKTLQVYLTANYENAGPVDKTNEATWTATNGTGSATVDKGLITGVSVGTVTINASYGDGDPVSLALTVEQGPKVTLSSVQVTPFREKETKDNITISTLGFSGTPTITASSSSVNVTASILGNGNLQIVGGNSITANETVDITVTATDGADSASAVCKVYLKAPVFTLSGTELSVKPGASSTITVTTDYFLSDVAITAPSGAPAKFSTSVSGSTITITGIEEGSGSITVNATDGTITRTGTISVTVANVLEYELVTDDSALTANSQLIIASTVSSNSYAMGAQSSSLRSSVSVTVADSKISGPSSDVKIVTLEGEAGAWYFKVDDGYLSYSGSNNNISTSATKDDACTWTISISSSNATIRPSTATTRLLSYNSSQPRFCVYGSVQNNIQLYGILVPAKQIVNSKMTVGTVSASTNDTVWTVDGFQFEVLYEGDSKYTDVSSATTFSVTEPVPTISADGTMKVTVTPTYGGVTYSEKAAEVDATLHFINEYAISRAYDYELDLNETQSNVTLDGIYMGYASHIRSNTTYYDVFIQDGEWGMEIYEASTSVPSYTINETYLTVSGTLKNYNYLYEMTSASVSVLSDATRKSHITAPSTYVVQGTEDENTTYLASRKTSLSGMVYSINNNTEAGTTAATGSNQSVYVTVGGNNVLLYIKNGQIDTAAAAKIVVGQPLTVEGFTTYFKSNNTATFEVLFDKIIEADDYGAVDFAKELLKNTKGYCNSNYDGITDNKSALTSIWTNLSTGGWLKVEAAGEASTLVNGTPDSEIIVPEGADASATDALIEAMTDADAIAAALYRYDYCTAKYKLTNFMERELTVSFDRIVLSPLGLAEGNATSIIIIVSVIGVSALGGFFFLRKRKEI